MSECDGDVASGLGLLHLNSLWSLVLALVVVLGVGSLLLRVNGELDLDSLGLLSGLRFESDVVGVVAVEVACHVLSHSQQVLDAKVRR